MTMFRNGTIAAALIVGLATLSPVPASAQTAVPSSAPMPVPMQMQTNKPAEQMHMTRSPEQRQMKRMHRTSAQKSMHSVNQVTRLQQKLNTTGADLKVDGVMGSRTRSAIATFQRAHGLEASGQMNRKTREMLRRI